VAFSRDDGGSDELPASVFSVQKLVCTVSALGTCRVRSGGA
jgi:hypothetical protein